jgi:hypothetical protein
MIVLALKKLARCAEIVAQEANLHSFVADKESWNAVEIRKSWRVGRWYQSREADFPIAMEHNIQQRRE